MNRCVARSVQLTIISRLSRSPAKVQIASLTAVNHGEKPDHPKPWPYQDLKFCHYHQYLDYTTKRLNENAKIICIDGNVGVGKADFAQHIAEVFGMYYLSPLDYEDMFRNPHFIPEGFDMKELNPYIPKSMRFFSMADVLSDPFDKRRMAYLQTHMYQGRFYDYAHASLHMLSTGQGVVMVRSPWTDGVMARALRNLGYFSQSSYEYYQEMAAMSYIDLWRPHVYIRLKAPISQLRKNIAKRNRPGEANSPLYTDAFFAEVDSEYEKILPKLEERSQILHYDWTPDGVEYQDYSLVTGDLERLDLTEELFGDSLGEVKKFRDWLDLREFEYADYRQLLSDPEFLRRKYFPPCTEPYKYMEMHIPMEEIQEYRKFLEEKVPMFKYRQGSHPEIDDYWKVLLLGRERKYRPYFRYPSPPYPWSDYDNARSITQFLSVFKKW